MSSSGGGGGDSDHLDAINSLLPKMETDPFPEATASASTEGNAQMTFSRPLEVASLQRPSRLSQSNSASPGTLSPSELVSPKQSPAEVPPSPGPSGVGTPLDMDTEGGLLESLLASAPPASAGVTRHGLPVPHGLLGSTQFTSSDLSGSSNGSSRSDGSSGSGLLHHGRKQQLRPGRHLGSFRSIGAGSGLEPIPEDEITEAPTIYQPLVPPALTKPVTSSYNISFPTTLQPRDRTFDMWRGVSPGSGSDTPFSLSRQNSEMGSANSVSSIGASPLPQQQPLQSLSPTSRASSSQQVRQLAAIILVLRNRLLTSLLVSEENADSGSWEAVIRSCVASCLQLMHLHCLQCTQRSNCHK